MSVSRSRIGWTDYSAGDANFVIGCTPVSEGCAHCYARAIEERAGRDFSQVRLYPEKLKRLRKTKFDWRVNGAPFRRGEGSRPMVFVVDLGDLFHEAVPDEFILEAIRVMRERSDVDWQVLTKRPHRAATFPQFHYGEPYPPNVWFGVTAENQRCADERLPVLLQIPAAVRFVSVEPMLGPVDLRQWLIDERELFWGGVDGAPGDRRLSWVICGAESGPRRRPFRPEWAQDLYEQCRWAGVPYFFKQSSGLRPGANPRLSGRTIQEFPQ